MRSWTAVLLLLIIAVAAAWGWHALALDPGEVRLRFGGWRVETSFVFGVIAALLLWAILSLVLRALFWPRRALRRHALRRGHERIADGLVAAIEGRHTQAAKSLERAAHVSTLQAPALLARARSAQAQGDDAQAMAALDAASEVAPAAALALRARFLLELNRNAEALDLLKGEIAKSSLPPAALPVHASPASAYCLTGGDRLVPRRPITRIEKLLGGLESSRGLRQGTPPSGIDRADRLGGV